MQAQSSTNYKCFYHKLNDKELIEKIVERDQLALEELVKRYLAKIKGLLYRLTRNSEDTKELAWKVFDVVWKKAYMFKGKSSFSTWLFAITRNEALMRLREPRHRLFMPVNDDHFTDIVDTAANPEMTEIVKSEMRDAANYLKNTNLGEIIFDSLAGYTNFEIAEKLNISVQAAKSRLDRSRRLLEIQDRTPGNVRRKLISIKPNRK